MEIIYFLGNIRVFARMKPGSSGPIKFDLLDPDSVTVECDPTPKHFVFDKVFGPDSTQIDVS